MPALHFFKFNVLTIQLLPPHATGVYLLRNAFGVVYVGKGRIRDRLMSHLRGDNPLIALYRPTEFAFELHADPDDRERSLIVWFNPPANQQIPKA